MRTAAQVLYAVVMFGGTVICFILWIGSVVSAFNAASLRKPHIGWWTAWSSVFPSILTLFQDPHEMFTEKGLAMRRRARRFLIYFLLVLGVMAAVALSVGWWLFPSFTQ